GVTGALGAGVIVACGAGGCCTGAGGAAVAAGGRAGAAGATGTCGAVGGGGFTEAVCVGTLRPVTWIITSPSTRCADPPNPKPRDAASPCGEGAVATLGTAE